MTSKEEHFWNNFLQRAQNELPKTTYEVFILDAKLLKVDKQVVHIAVSKVKLAYWQETLHQIVLPLILAEGYATYGQHLSLNFSEQKEVAFHDEFHDTNIQSLIEENYFLQPVKSNLQEKYTFDNFIQGEGNRFALVASQTVAREPGSPYNPLFIWGGPGLGKTHLLNAIGNAVLKRHPKARVRYISTEEFLNEFISAVKNKKTEELKEKYRTLDYLLIDDIQFLTGESTQNEFFHTFDALLKLNKQIVLTSDRIPSQLKKLEERLVTRFSWGTTIDITPPDYETRFAIIKSKLDNYHLDFPNESIEYLAKQFNSNIREIEGALNSINLIATVKQTRVITVDLIAEALRAMTQKEPKIKIIPIEKIQEEVGKFYGLTAKDIKGTKRVQSIAMARQVAMYLTRELTDYSLPKIGKEFGGRDHSTVLHSYRKIDALLKTDSSLQQEIDSIIANLR